MFHLISTVVRIQYKERTSLFQLTRILMNLFCFIMFQSELDALGSMFQLNALLKINIYKKYNISSHYI